MKDSRAFSALNIFNLQVIFKESYIMKIAFLGKDVLSLELNLLSSTILLFKFPEHTVIVLISRPLF